MTSLLSPSTATDSWFRLKPIRVARVSEISETTAAAGVPRDERVDFHIGNPLQDARLSSAFLRLALGLSVQREDLRDSEPETILEHLRWSGSDKPKLEFLIRLIQKSAPYAPRGGYQRTTSPPLIQAFRIWLEQQQEPLQYDTGEQSGRREIILTSGGISETLRVLLLALSTYLEVTPARVWCYRYELGTLCRAVPNLLFEDLDADERTAREQIEQWVTLAPKMPTFIVLGDQLSEETRRKLRGLCLEHPLFFIEANHAPNHLSLAREAKLVQRVIRLLRPAIFAPRLRTLSLVFVVGNADFLNVIENVHFNLKGTPAASEIELLTFLLEQKLVHVNPAAPASVPALPPAFEGLALGESVETLLPRLAAQVEHTVEKSLNEYTAILTQALTHLEERTLALYGHLEQRLAGYEHLVDEFSDLTAKELLEQLIQNLHHPAWCQSLQRSFLSAFLKHQPYYRAEACQVVSGSARTALGILGFHCGIREVVIPDLSWSYEQCFPIVHAVPLKPSLDLDVDGLINQVETLRRDDPAWVEHGAVVLNNPHNGTGRIFSEAAVRRLLTYCLQHHVYVIDDLAYQNVAPVDALPEIKTVRQIATELVQLGLVGEEQAARVLTVHSLSKTDCLAGARMAIVEIREPQLAQRFREVNALIQPNLAAIFIGYLFYRNPPEAVRAYWHLRNRLFHERTQALVTAVENLPAERNPCGLKIIPPAGSMYPLLHIERLPAGLALDWLASSLARRGIGLLPLTTFARTAEGYETGRAAFRLTLGGIDGAETLLSKTRRLLIDLNRLIVEEQAHYNRKSLAFQTPRSNYRTSELQQAWDKVSKQILRACQNYAAPVPPPLDRAVLQHDFTRAYVPARLEVFRTRLLDRALINDEVMHRAQSDNGTWLAEHLAQELLPDTLARRWELFRSRAYDRTVHPTQMYALQTEQVMDRIIEKLIARELPEAAASADAAQALWREYLGQNVAITSQDEAEEILLDLDAHIASEVYAELFTSIPLPTFLSFWSDWDGSTRPSGQGHRLVAAIVMENVRRLSQIITLLQRVEPHLTLDPELASELARLPQRHQNFTRLLNQITQLTHHLEQRYRGILPFAVSATPWQRWAIRLHLMADPTQVLWQHNDRLEIQMREMRHQRRVHLQYYFELNQRLQQQLAVLLPALQAHRTHTPLLRAVVRYRNLLRRVVITPRIHQGLITARDPFAIDTTVYNLHELNALAGTYGYPGMVLGLQISLSTKPEALIALERKMRTQREQTRREYPTAELPLIGLIPLFEDIDSINNIRTYLERVWDYATQSRSMTQSPQQRFAESIPEIFIAGSDLSQQVGQARAAALFHQAKYETYAWLAEHHLVEHLRIKLGSGEPMQRQGGYYSDVAGRAAFLDTEDSRHRFSTHLPAAARRSTAYAVTPLQGIFLGADLRTIQSNLAERMRTLPVRELTSVRYHLHESQRHHRNDLIRAAETITESRLGARRASQQELERLTLGVREPLYDDFLTELSDSFRHILYGREEDVVGIHIVSYFIGRSIPQLRDRPTSRRMATAGAERGPQILASIAEMIPLAQQGSLLRAITHNQAQTVVLGINQLTTGLFRALERFAQKTFAEAERERMLAERVLPRLPVYEILSTLRMYQDWQGEFWKRIEAAFPAGNSALVALREDNDAMLRYLPLFQQELLRRHGVDVQDFFQKGVFIPDLLPTLRPDLAVLLQKDLFNTNSETMLANVSGHIADTWRAEVTRLLELPQRIRYWRAIIWEVIGESIEQRVKSFTELALALYAFSSTRTVPASSRISKPPASLVNFFRTARADDEMRRFLLGAVEYLSSFVDGNVEVPVSILRAMNDVKRIAQIEESALPPEKQKVLRCCLLQIARLAGENG